MANKLILQDAIKVRDSITATQSKNITKLYNDWADEIIKNAKSYSRRNTHSAMMQERQMKESKKMLTEASQNVSNSIYKGIKQSMYTVSDAMVKSSVDWLSSLGFSIDGLNGAFNHVPEDVVRNLITGQVYQSGWSLSSRIWGENEKTLKDIYQIIAKGAAENVSIYDIAKQLEQYVRPGASKKWNLIAPDGIKIYKKQIDYNAQRLARTLIQHSYQQSFVAVTKDNPFIEKYIWRANGSRVCPLCASRDGAIFEKNALPLDHPNGMCFIEPVVADNLVDKIADWFNSPDGTYPEIDEFAKELGYH